MSEKLNLASKIALRDYMGLKKDETLLVITDEYKQKIGKFLFAAGKKLCKESLYVEMKAREMNGQEPPSQIAELMKLVDVVVCPTEKSLTHTNARREAVKLGVRIGTMPGILEQTMIRCLNANANRIVKLTKNVAEALSYASTIRVITKIGTDVTMDISGRKIFQSTGVLTNRGDSGNLPSGEVYLAPLEGKTNGRIIIDGSMAGIGLLKNPIAIEIRNGYAEKITGKAEAKQLTKIFNKVGYESRAVAEFGIGTNYMAKLIGQILEDEKVLGTIHIAFGNNLSMGGTISIQSHLDGLITKPTVLVDDVAIMENGELLL